MQKKPRARRPSLAQVAKKWHEDTRAWPGKQDVELKNVSYYLLSEDFSPLVGLQPSSPEVEIYQLNPQRSHSVDGHLRSSLALGGSQIKAMQVQKTRWKATVSQTEVRDICRVGYMCLKSQDDIYHSSIPFVCVSPLPHLMDLNV